MAQSCREGGTCWKTGKAAERANQATHVASGLSVFVVMLAGGARLHDHRGGRGLLAAADLPGGGRRPPSRAADRQVLHRLLDAGAGRLVSETLQQQWRAHISWPWSKHCPGSQRAHADGLPSEHLLVIVFLLVMPCAAMTGMAVPRRC
jgi:hypothetical protein